jgi:hypothetical protein
MDFIKHILLFCIFAPTLSSAQTNSSTHPIDITSDFVQLDKVSRPSVSMVMDAEADAFSKAWRTFLRKEHGLKTRERRGVISAEAVTFSAITNKTLDFFTVVRPHEKGVKVDVVIALGYDVFLSRQHYSDEFRKMEQLLGDFSKDFIRERFNKAISDKEKAIKQLEKSVAKDSKQLQKLQSAIDKDNKSIDKLLRRLDDNKNKLDEVGASLPGQEQLLRSKRGQLNDLQRGLQKVQ